MGGMFQVHFEHAIASLEEMKTLININDGDAMTHNNQGTCRIHWLDGHRELCASECRRTEQLKKANELQKNVRWACAVRWIREHEQSCSSLLSSFQPLQQHRRSSSPWEQVEQGNAQWCPSELEGSGSHLKNPQSQKMMRTMRPLRVARI